MSDALTAYVDDEAPEISLQPAPLSSHRSQAKAKEIGVAPLHEPELAVSVSPVAAVPVIVGAALLPGAVADRAITLPGERSMAPTAETAAVRAIAPTFRGLRARLALDARLLIVSSPLQMDRSPALGTRAAVPRSRRPLHTGR